MSKQEELIKALAEKWTAQKWGWEVDAMNEEYKEFISDLNALISQIVLGEVDALTMPNDVLKKGDEYAEEWIKNLRLRGGSRTYDFYHSEVSIAFARGFNSGQISIINRLTGKE